MQDPHDDLKRALRTVKRLLETAESEDAAPDEAKELLFDTVGQFVFQVEKLLAASALEQTPTSKHGPADSGSSLQGEGEQEDRENAASR